jgi:hypothetical protein
MFTDVAYFPIYGLGKKMKFDRSLVRVKSPGLLG